jgi:hypothetical protein
MDVESGAYYLDYMSILGLLGSLVYFTVVKYYQVNISTIGRAGYVFLVVHILLICILHRSVFSLGHRGVVLVYFLQDLQIRKAIPVQINSHFYSARFNHFYLTLREPI